MRECDILLHVVDVAHPQMEDHIKTVVNTMTELKVGDKPQLLVFNKIDLYRERYFDALLDSQTKADLERELQEHMKNTFGHESVFISAHSKEGMDELRETMNRMIKEMYVVRYPYQIKGW